MNDCISRQDAIAEIYDKYMSSDMAVHNDVAKECMRIIKALPSVTPTQNCVENALGALDCISRQAVLDGIDTYINKAQSTGTQDDFYSFAELVVKELPSVNPQEPKTGHWKSFTHSAYHGIDNDGEPIWREVKVYHCNLCNRRTVIKENYCPNCGARMVEPQEVGDKG